MFKKRLRRHFPATATRERAPARPMPEPAKPVAVKFVIIIVLIIGVVAAHQTGAAQFLDQERLQALLEQYGMLAPLLYMAIYTIAPALLLPALPIVIVGGILFGPFWGVVYSIISATAGACLAFLISRYLARDLIRNRLVSARWRHLDQQVAEHGWKMVALTRLIPIFPFNLLNYAFGLTGIRFSHYAMGTFLFMLPGCIAFVVFSSSLLDLFHGRVSPAFLIGLALITAVSVTPVLYQMIKHRYSTR